MKIQREDLKSNFLRRVILRIDYKGLVDIQDTVKKIQKLMKENEFVEMSDDYISEAEFELHDPIVIESQISIPLKELQKIRSYKFRNAKKDKVFEINSLFMALNITVNEYMAYETYGHMFIDIFSSVLNDNMAQ